MSVYFLRRQTHDLIKIGHSKNPYDRRSTVQTEIGEPVVLLAYIPGARTEEKALHLRFWKHHVVDEWFWPDAELTDFVSSVPPAPPRLRGIVYPFADRLREARGGDVLTYRSAGEVANSSYHFAKAICDAQDRGITIMRDGWTGDVRSNKYAIMMLEDCCRAFD